MRITVITIIRNIVLRNIEQFYCKNTISSREKRMYKIYSLVASKFASTMYFIGEPDRLPDSSAFLSFHFLRKTFSTNFFFHFISFDIFGFCYFWSSIYCSPNGFFMGMWKNRTRNNEYIFRCFIVVWTGEMGKLLRNNFAALCVNCERWQMIATKIDKWLKLVFFVAVKIRHIHNLKCLWVVMMFAKSMRMGNDDFLFGT